MLRLRVEPDLDHFFEHVLPGEKEVAARGERAVLNGYPASGPVVVPGERRWPELARHRQPHHAGDGCAARGIQPGFSREEQQVLFEQATPRVEFLDELRVFFRTEELPSRGRKLDRDSGFACQFGEDPVGGGDGTQSKRHRCQAATVGRFGRVRNSAASFDDGKPDHETGGVAPVVVLDPYYEGLGERSARFGLLAVTGLDEKDRGHDDFFGTLAGGER